MLPARAKFSPPLLTSERLFPLGPFPRHIWIHSNTPRDGLDEVCYEIWKRAHQLSEALQPPPQGHALCSDLSPPLRTDTTDIQSGNYLLDEPEGLESIYKAVIRNTEREMKLRALCGALLPANNFSKTDSNEATKNPVTTATQVEKRVKYNACTSGFSTPSMTTALNQPVWQTLSFSSFPNHSNFPQFQGPYLRVRMPHEQALRPSCGSYSRQVVPYSPQQIFQPPYSPVLTYSTLVQPAYLYPSVTTPTLSNKTQDLSAMAGNKIQYPFAPCYRFGSRPEGAVMFNYNYCGSESYIKF